MTKDLETIFDDMLAVLSRTAYCNALSGTCTGVFNVVEKVIYEHLTELNHWRNALSPHIDIPQSGHSC